ncbi:acyl-CoA carboxylase subunit beta [Desulfosporosinus youngiae]|uniref:Acetyl-CoA carboxylase, carboxyltransferase component (Subunits alpha and beta) n=1 Tax=Desulfosporosinus youngiae DSM 17734 TaxID=768710 RepID=H5Y218_9FIRM|nr:carboxyl transferase domain-containing protein [Desulfosporosinus youngiae]EHQ88216.1 acetyl-CoA carboxylase, carboxyltransferase component (subunits alpha and beta) [Desulfosporosinus youngiae DSM 17734]
MVSEFGYSMPRYFEKMDDLGKPLKKVNAKNVDELLAVEAEIDAEAERIKNGGKPTEKVNASGEWTAWQRIEYLVEPGTWCPLHTIYDPAANEEGTTAVIDGIGKVNGRWVVVIASDNKYLAGAWIPGQADNITRVTDIAKRMNLPLVWILNCSGVKLSHQEEVYPNRIGGGTPFYRHTELEQMGLPVIVGIYGTNPAGGGYHSISPTILIAHEKANMAVGGAGIVGGMSPKGYVDEEAAQALIDATRGFKSTPPGRAVIHHRVTGFFREVAESEEGVLDKIKKYVGALPAYNPEFFRVADPAKPKFSGEDLRTIVPTNQRRGYDIYEVLARLFDNSEHKEYKPDFGLEMYTGIAKIDGLLCGFIANKQGVLKNYPEYTKEYIGIGGKLYRQGLIKMSEFVTLCNRDKLPIVWIQDTTGIDVGDIAESAELLGLGQSLIYSIQNTDIPQMEITLRKGTAAAHYVLGGPQGGKTNAFSIGTAATEINVMHGETAAAAMYSRRLVKDQDSGKPLDGTIAKMNDLIKAYREKSKPAFCAKKGFVDEIVKMPELRNYIKAFVGGVYQNPKAICPIHQMIIPRVIKDHMDVYVNKSTARDSE